MYDSVNERTNKYFFYFNNSKKKCHLKNNNHQQIHKWGLILKELKNKWKSIHTLKEKYMIMAEITRNLSYSAFEIVYFMI